MSRFNEFAKRVDAEVKAYFEKYSAAAQKVKSIDKKIEKYKNSSDQKAQYEIEMLRIKRKEANEELTAISRQNSNVLRAIAQIRSELEGNADEYFAADPSKIDNGTLRLIESGILSVSEFERLSEKAAADQNFTMLRLIGQGAKDAAEGRFVGDRNARERLNNVVSNCNQYTTGAVLRSFDELTNVAKVAVGDPNSYSRERSEPNPAFYEHWDEVTSEVIASF